MNTENFIKSTLEHIHNMNRPISLKERREAHAEYEKMKTNKSFDPHYPNQHKNKGGKC